MFSFTKSTLFISLSGIALFTTSTIAEENRILVISEQPVLIDFEFSPDSRRVALTAGINDAQIWDIEKRTRVLTYTPEHALNQIAFSPDGNHVITGGLGINQVTMWDTRTGEKIRTFDVPGVLEDTRLNFHVGEVDFSLDGSKYMAAYGSYFYIYDRYTGEPISRIHVGTEVQSSILSNAGFVNGYNQLFVMGAFYDINSGELLRTIPGTILLEERNWVIGFRSDSDASYVRVFDALTGSLIGEWREPYRSGRRRLAFSTEGSLMLQTNDNNELEVLKLGEAGLANIVKRIPLEGEDPFDNLMFSMKISPDKQKIGISYGKNLLIYDISDITSRIPNVGLYQSED